MDLILSNLTGKIQASYYKNNNLNAPIAVVFHDSPTNNGNMNEKVNYTIFYSFLQMGFSVIRFDFRGCGKSNGTFEGGDQELMDASSIVDYIQTQHENASEFWLSGVGFGAWIAMQILMRRVEVTHYIAVSPYTKKYDYSFFSPAPCNGTMIGAALDEIIPEASIKQLCSTINKYGFGQVSYNSVKDAPHNYEGKLHELFKTITKYIKNNSNYIKGLT